MSAPILPTPNLRVQALRDEQSGPWFDALAEGVLAVRTCERCAHVCRPDTSSCPACYSDALRWTPAQGRATVVSLIADHAAVHEGGPPLTLGLVELDEGPWLHVRLLDGPQVGDQVTLVVLAPAEGEPFPAFRRGSTGSAAETVLD